MLTTPLSESDKVTLPPFGLLRVIRLSVPTVAKETLLFPPGN